MSADINPDPSARAAIPPAALAAVAVALVAVLGFLGCQTFAPKVYAPPPPPPRSNSNADLFKSWARRRYKETGGDWSKLPPQDQQRFMNEARGKGKPLFDSFKP